MASSPKLKPESSTYDNMNTIPQVKLTQEKFDRELTTCLTILETHDTHYVCEYVDLALYKRIIHVIIVA